MKTMEAIAVEQEVDSVWMQMLAREWSEEWADAREDIYTLEDGQDIEAHQGAMPCCRKP